MVGVGGGGRRWRAYAAVFVVAAFLVVAWFMWKHLHKRQENFEDAAAVAESAREDAEDGEDGQRDDDGKEGLVQAVFHTVLRRKPTSGEISKYSSIASRSKLVDAIVRDYKVQDACPAEVEDPQPYSNSDFSEYSDYECSDETAGPDTDTDTDDDEDNKEPAKPGSSVTKKITGSITARVQVTPRNPKVKPHPPKPDPKPDLPSGHVCLDKKDVLDRLTAICDQVEQFKQLISMLG
jgi:hypothetical protein